MVQFSVLTWSACSVRTSVFRDHIMFLLPMRGFVSLFRWRFSSTKVIRWCQTFFFENIVSLGRPSRIDARFHVACWPWISGFQYLNVELQHVSFGTQMFQHWFGIEYFQCCAVHVFFVTCWHLLSPNFFARLCAELYKAHRNVECAAKAELRAARGPPERLKRQPPP